MASKKLVNWQGSMELSAAIFNQQDDYFIDSIRDSICVRMTNYNYGLLPAEAGSAADSGIHISQHVTGHIEIQLEHCNIVTSSGIRIRYDATEAGGALEKTYTPSSDGSQEISQWDIILAADPFNRVATGTISPEENPPRYPDSEASCKLYVMPAGENSYRELGKHYLTVGRIRKEGDRYMVNTDYIPPCIAMKSHESLMEYYNTFGTQLQAIESAGKVILTKVRNRTNRSELPMNIATICEDVMAYISSVYFNYRNKGAYAAPVEIVGCMSGLAHRVYVSLCRFSGINRDELLRYFYEWSNVTPGSFEELLSDTLEIRYDHNNIRSMMVRVTAFMNTLTETWQRISQLEYIGQHKENIIVSESQVGNTTAPQRTWEILDQ